MHWHAWVAVPGCQSSNAIWKLGLCLPSIGAPAYMDEGESGWGSEWDKEGASGGIGPGAGGSLLPTKEGGMSILGSTFCL